jgi:hypothetical protein
MQVGAPKAAELLQGVVGRRLGQRLVDLGPEAPLRLLGHRRQQGLAALEMPERRAR